MYKLQSMLTVFDPAGESDWQIQRHQLTTKSVNIPYFTSP
jgi:hypothetical protein